MTSEPNPYAPPDVDEAPTPDEPDEAAHGSFVPAGRRVPAGHGWTWITTGFQLYRQNKLTWFLIVILWLVAAGVLGQIPYGSLVVGALQPFFVAGLMLGISTPNEEGRLSVGHLFRGRARRRGALSGLVGVQVGWTLVSLGLVSFGGFGAMFGNPQAVGRLAFTTETWVALALYLVLGTIVWFGTLFAPALVVFHDMSVTEALRGSMRGITKNLRAASVYYLALFVGLPIASLFTCGVGMLVIVALMYTSVFAAYRDVYFVPAKRKKRKRKKARSEGEPATDDEPGVEAEPAS
jgi:hypothetical protein